MTTEDDEVVQMADLSDTEILDFQYDYKEYESLDKREP